VQWADWLGAQGAGPPPERFALRFDRAQLVLDAAVQGLGVALESTTIAARHIEEGRLVALFPAVRSLTVQGHFVVHPARHGKRHEVEAFVRWLHAQAAATGDPLAASDSAPVGGRKAARAPRRTRGR
jgi:DNA-binding transcriptional LysR family regulator